MDRERINKLSKDEVVDLTVQIIGYKHGSHDFGKEALYDMLERIENKIEEEDKEKIY